MANRKKHEIHRALYFWSRKRNIVSLPNFYIGYFEADLMAIDDKKEHIIEYEVKISKQDFKADFLKSKCNGRSERIFKHALLKSGKRVHRFYFVSPKGVIEKEDVPTYSGLIAYDQYGFKIIKRAPIIASFDLGRSFYKDLAISCAYREANIRHKYKFKTDG